MSTHDELMAKIRANPEDEASWQVLQDWLIGEGDPRGRLAGASPGEVAAVLEELAPEWCGREVSVSGDTVQMHEDLANTYSPGIALTFAHGHVHTLKVTTTWDGGEEVWGEEWILPTLAKILSQPVGQLILEIELRATPYEEFTYDGLTEAVTDAGPLAVRKFYAGDNDQLSWTNVPDCTSLWESAPYLQEVKLEGSRIQLGEPSHPELRSLTLVSGGLPTEPMAALASADLPKLEHLEVWFGSSDYGAECSYGDVAPLLAHGFPALRHVGLQNCEFADEILAHLGEAVWLPQVTSLCFAGSVLRDAGGASLLALAPRLAHVTRIDVSDGYLTPEMVARLEAAFGDRIVTGRQKAPSNWGNGDRYYVAVGE